MSKRRSRSPGRGGWLWALLCGVLWGAPVAAQVIRDGSIGPAGAPLAVPSGLDPNGDFADYLIGSDLGEISGGTLYHSFGTFSVSTGEVATFTGPDAITTVVSRNTGAAGLFLNGTLRSTMPSAELFFLSPGGVVIGEGARLDVPSSVHFSTAHVFRFADGPASDLLTGSLARPVVLSSAPPSAFGFGPSPAPISVGVVDPGDSSRTLSVPPGETFSLVGGDVTLTGVPNAAPFFYQGDVIGAPGAHVEIASTSGDQDVPLQQVAGKTRLDLDRLPPGLLDGDVLFQLNARVDVGAAVGTQDAAGSLAVRAGRFRILDGRIEATHRSDVVDAGDIDIGTRDEIELDTARLTSATAAAGRGSDIRLEGGSVLVRGDSLIRIISTGAGASGDFTAVATDVAVTEQAEISSINTNVGAGGDIRLVARGASGEGRIEIRGEGETITGVRLASTLLSNPRGAGAGGRIVLEGDTIEIADTGEVLSIARGGATGTGGSIDLRGTDVSVDSGSFVASSTERDAAGGAVSVEGLDGGFASRVVVRNAGGESEPARISTNTVSTAPGAGPGGALTVRAQRLELLRGGQLFARTEGTGDAGILTVDADSILISGILDNPSAPTDPFRSGITSRVGDDGALGSATLLSIDTRVLEVEDGGQISTATFGVGDAGALRITSTERMTVTGGPNGASLVSAQAVAGPASPGGGRGGLLTIDTERLELRDGGQIAASTAGQGNPGNVGDAGDVEIRAGSVEISGASGFDASGIFSKSDSAATSGVGDGGDVTLTVDRDLVLDDGGLIEVSSTGDGDAGNIQLTLGGSLRMDGGARIQSSSGATSRGSAGSIGIDAGLDVSLAGGSEISASTGVQSTGPGGRVTIRTARTLGLVGASAVRSSSDGFGDAGDIEIAALRVSAIEGSAISTRANAASGGSIRVDAGERIGLADASITTSVQGQAQSSDAGNISIRSPGLAVVNGSAIVADAVQGAGGRIEIFSDGNFISGDSLISASSERGPQGEIDLTPPESALLSELNSLPAALEDPSQLLRSACDRRTEREGSFTVRATPRVAPPPDQLLQPPRVSPPDEDGGCE